MQIVALKMQIVVLKIQVVTLTIQAVALRIPILAIRLQLRDLENSNIGLTEDDNWKIIMIIQLVILKIQMTLRMTILHGPVVGEQCLNLDPVYTAYDSTKVRFQES